MDPELAVLGLIHTLGQEIDKRRGFGCLAVLDAGMLFPCDGSTRPGEVVMVEHVWPEAHNGKRAVRFRGLAMIDENTAKKLLGEGE